MTEVQGLMTVAIVATALAFALAYRLGFYLGREQGRWEHFNRQRE